MNQTNDARLEVETTEKEQRRSRWLTAGGVAGAILASSCCILPLIFVTLGVSGAWIGSLTALEPYKPYTLAVTAVLLAGGFWHVYFRPQKACVDGSYCARPASGRIIKTVLWLATIVAVLAATINYWAPLFY
ncbi:MAG: mercuric transporter MerT family protein [Wenzhouxiangellaceae bacterium]|nr:mercuric transporter MerT family protein [Wenzhouxiangellaceae bacterium]